MCTTISILCPTDRNITATLTVTPRVLVPEFIGFVQACVGLDAEPTQSIMITFQTVDGIAQGTLLFIRKTSH